MSPKGNHAQDPRDIARWAKRYAQNRTIPFLVQWVFIVALVIMVGSLSFAALKAWQRGHITMVWVCTGGTFASILFLTWFATSRWAGKQIWRITQWIYGKEGYAAYLGGGKAGHIKLPTWVLIVGAGLAAYHMIGAIMVGLGRLPMAYAQPLSALYMVPFFVIMIVKQRLGFWAWFWPVLYGIHAVLLLAGAPIHFPGQWLILDVIVPIFGYALVSILVGHFYSRYAFRRLKELARAGLVDVPDMPDEEEEAPEE